jgi:hypothetical protein
VSKEATFGTTKEIQRTLLQRHDEGCSLVWSTATVLLSRFITMEKLREVCHVMDTQVNDSMNNTISWLAPKNKCYGGSQSLQNRIAIANGINSLGLHKYYTRIFHALGIRMTPNIVHFLTVKERNRKKRIKKRKTKEQKKERNKGIFEKIHNEEVIKQKERHKKEALTGLA